MKSRSIVLAAALAVLPAAPALAQAKMVDLTDPMNVAMALEDAGYDAEVKTSEKGSPYIVSHANGSEFIIRLYGCEEQIKCTSLEFFSRWEPQPWFTAELANEWNSSKRFMFVSVNEKGELMQSMDLPGSGPVSFDYFADALDWYVTIDGQFNEWLEAREPDKKTK
ncbi:YbjN domain-containing protein [Sphingomonas canadensis]|uniref:YbjN domain-containing protein n=1 Tax=Sphingomonas canadensis TaxID=1219257 RepID=A0ABW3H8R7_9SPHN|nr:YbjN domain-containing protein [Sphingomonas canadensis]MCW3836704.1 YbjN domain-containing protein [Sphingomonas canadensis]